MHSISKELDQVILLNTLDTYTDENNKQISVTTPDYEKLKELKNTIYLVTQILSSRRNEFFVEKTVNQYRLGRTPLGNRILTVLSKHREQLEVDFVDHELTPLVTLFIKHIKLSQLDVFIDHHYHLNDHRFKVKYDELNRWVVLLNGFVNAIRVESRSPAFRLQTRKYFARGKSNLKSMRRLVKHIFATHARVLVIRIDLKYTEHIESGVLKKPNLVPFEQARRDRKRFFRHICEQRNHPIFKHLIGGAWKLERGRRSGFHHHCILFFDGAHVQRDIYIGKLLCDYWDTNITNGRGKAHNCNGQKQTYEARNMLGIGMINYYESDLRKNLDAALKYLCKGDFYVQCTIDCNHHAFGRMQILGNRSKRGRPREYVSVA